MTEKSKEAHRERELHAQTKANLDSNQLYLRLFIFTVNPPNAKLVPKFWRTVHDSNLYEFWKMCISMTQSQVIQAMVHPWWIVFLTDKLTLLLYRLIQCLRNTFLIRKVLLSHKHIPWFYIIYSLCFSKGSRANMLAKHNTFGLEVVMDQMVFSWADRNSGSCTLHLRQLHFTSFPSFGRRKQYV